MIDDRKLYQRLLDTEWKMCQGCMGDLITWDEYNEFNRYGARVESLLENKYSEEVVREWRFNH